MTTYNIQALRGPSDSDSQVYGLNANGEVSGVAFPETPEIGMEGVLWMSGGPIFNLPPNSESILYGVNKAGDAVGLRGFDNTSTEVPILVRGGGARISQVNWALALSARISMIPACCADPASIIRLHSRLTPLRTN